MKYQIIAKHDAVKTQVLEHKVVKQAIKTAELVSDEIARDEQMDEAGTTIRARLDENEILKGVTEAAGNLKKNV